MLDTSRPRKIASHQELQAKVNGYFTECIEKEVPPTMSGLAMYCGFKSRMSLLSYRDIDEDYQEVLDNALLRIQDFNEQKLTTARNASGAIFALKNCHDGWNETLDLNANAKVSLEDLVLQNEDAESM